jgi:NAD(P)-dependent dehydrogenase (short-subunit alcohol dehydrogenase family)
MKDKTILVTGATDGIGKQTALELAGMGARVLLHGRSRARAEATLSEIRSATASRSLDLFVADLASIQQVHQLAAAVSEKYDRLHVLINNAGLIMNERQLTEDGLETTFAVNHLAHFLLTHLLLDSLKRSAPARIVNVSSMTHQGVQVDFDNLQGERSYSGYGAYSLSKLANILFTYELAERLAGTGVTANALHPGVIGTKLLRQGFGGAGGGDLGAGAQTPLYLASSPEVEGVTGQYFIRRQAVEPSALAYDRDLRRRFWEVSERLAGLS